MLRLAKFVVRKFRSIKNLEICLLTNILTLIGPNEGGKSNILKALEWTNTSDKLSIEDKPANLDVSDDDVIVDLFYEVTNKEELLKRLIDFYGLELSKDANIVFSNIAFIKISKKANGEFQYDILDYNIRSIYSEIEKVLMSDSNFIENFLHGAFRSIIAGILVQNNIDTKHVDKILRHPVFVKVMDTMKTHIREQEKMKEVSFEDIIKAIDMSMGSIPNNVVQFRFDNREINMNIRDILNRIKIKLTSKLKNKLGFLDDFLSKIKPRFVYLSGEMELKGRIIKKNSWVLTITEESREYSIVYRLFRVLGIDINEFDNSPISNLRLKLKNKLIEFSKKINDNWSQTKMEFDCNVAEHEISLYIEEYRNNTKIREVPPENKSRGFKWYLAYRITLDYLKKERNAIFLLDDPAVFLHIRGQKDFVDILEKLATQGTQIIYTTHLVSLFNIRRLERVLLIEQDKHGFTMVRRPWTSEEHLVEAPVYHALGFEKLIFENVNKIMFVEGVSDKFIIEGLQEVDKDLGEWYVYPLSGGDKIEDNKIVEKIKKLSCLSGIHNLEVIFLLDGDKHSVKEKLNEKYRILLMGNENEELEDLIDREFYLNCVLNAYRLKLLGHPDLFNKIKIIVKRIRNAYSNAYMSDTKSRGPFRAYNITIKTKSNNQETTLTNPQKLTKILNKEFDKELKKRFDKVLVAIYIKTLILKQQGYKEKLNNVIEAIKQQL